MSQIESVGSMGFDPNRSDQRTYTNHQSHVTELNFRAFRNDLEEAMYGSRSPDTISAEGNPRTRAVFRAVADRSLVRTALQDKELFGLTEAVLPLPTGEYLWYLGRNTVGREVAETEREEALQQLTQARTEVSPLTNLTLPRGHRLIESVEDPEQLLNLWGGSFGWQQSGVLDFQARIEEQNARPASERTTWYTGLVDPEGRLIGSTMAERLSMPSAVGSVSLVESTEWSIASDKRGHRHGETMVAAQDRRIARELIDTPNMRYAEVNLRSGAHRMALRTGFVLPEFRTEHGDIDQILWNNVPVGDGHEPQGAYRNFAIAVAA